MATLTAVGALLRVPLPYVPITLQVTFVCLAGLWLGPWRGGASQVVYVTAGLVGFPVFAGGGGLHYALEPSFGYLVGFIPGAFVIGWLTRSPKAPYGRCLLGVYAGLAVVYALGVAYLFFSMNVVLGTDLSPAAIALLGLGPLPKDLALSLFTVYLGLRLRRVWTPPRMPPRPPDGPKKGFGI